VTDLRESLFEATNRVRQRRLAALAGRQTFRVLKWHDIDSIDNRDPKLVAAVLSWVERFLKPYFRSDVHGVECIPQGPVLLVGNHSYGLPQPDAFLLLAALYRAYAYEGVPYALGHDAIFVVPALHHLAARLGVVRACHENAMRLLAAGQKVLVYPGGDVDSCRPWRKRNKIEFDGRTGYINQALLANVPICPVVTAGAQSTLLILDDLPWLARLLCAPQLFRLHAWPLALSVPWGLTLGPFLAYLPFPARILTEVLEPIYFDRAGEDASSDEAYVRVCADKVEAAMQTALGRLADERQRGNPAQVGSCPSADSIGTSRTPRRSLASPG
jgi:1-acyl-sn-glycerol-3-phosphate acyltransferase